MNIYTDYDVIVRAVERSLADEDPYEQREPLMLAAHVIATCSKEQRAYIWEKLSEYNAQQKVSSEFSEVVKEGLDLAVQLLSLCTEEQRAYVWKKLQAENIHVQEVIPSPSEPSSSVLASVAKDIEEVFRKHGLKPEAVSQLVGAVEKTDRGGGNDHDN